MHAYAHVLQLQAENSTEQINVLAISSVNSDINIVISAHVRHLMNRWNLTKLELLEEHDLHMPDGQMKKYRTRFCFQLSYPMSCLEITIHLLYFVKISNIVV